MADRLPGLAIEDWKSEAFETIRQSLTMSMVRQSITIAQQFYSSSYRKPSEQTRTISAATSIKRSPSGRNALNCTANRTRKDGKTRYLRSSDGC